MKTHLAYIQKNLLQTYHNTGFFWLLKNSKQVNNSELSGFSPQIRHKPADVNLFIKVYYLPFWS